MSETKPIQVMVLGLRGFPDVQGGVETHCQALYPLLVERGFKVDVLTRAPYADPQLKTWQGVRFHRLWSPRSSGLEAMLHSLLGVCYAALRRPDVLHIHAIGPAIVTPLARLFGLKTVVTHHGPDYDREKWGRFARFILKAGEFGGMRFSNARIVISEVIRTLVRQKHGKESTLIPNGVRMPGAAQDGEAQVLDELDLTAGRYVLLVSRMVPEKRHADLIRAFAGAELEGWKLVLVGDVSAADNYVTEVSALAGQTGNVVIAGFRRGAQLAGLLRNAGIFVLPSSHEGLPIALLEAMSYGLPVIASDIPAHLELQLAEPCYFPLGDVDALSARLQAMAADAVLREQVAEAGKAMVREKYDWADVADKTAALYRQVVAGTAPQA
ncbi:glycosyltransferase family 4 protein [Granulosicoccaceae sp. 1_MG-2023]|nr:glycosyltransferase family 4 protein [Granulosicoccaceae sp. 1_MG-2023]